ncbi:MAG: DUF6612 family protein [Halobacteriales archaeon]
MPGPRRLAIALLLVVTLVAAGCLGSLGDDGTADAAEIKAASLEAIESVDSHAFEMELEQDLGALEATLTIDGQSDVRANRSSMTMSVPELEMPETEVIVVENRTYQQMPQTDDWVVTETEEFEFDRQELDGMAEVIDDAEASLDGTDEVDGHEVHVLNLDLDEESYSSILEGGLADDDVEMELDEIDVVQYVDVDSDLVRRMEMDYSGSMTGTGGSTQPFEATLTTTYDDFGESFDIEAPEDAIPADEYDGPTQPL